jgi:hypothetical protein
MRAHERKKSPNLPLPKGLRTSRGGWAFDPAGECQDFCVFEVI